MSIHAEAVEAQAAFVRDCREILGPQFLLSHYTGSVWNIGRPTSLPFARLWLWVEGPVLRILFYRRAGWRGGLPMWERTGEWGYTTRQSPVPVEVWEGIRTTVEALDREADR